MDIRILAPEEMIEAQVTLPLSKSMYNRAVLMHALTSGAPTFDIPSPCDDGTMMLQALQSTSGEVNIGHAGTAMRFLTAYYAATDDTCVTLDGSERMRQRPIGVLVDALRGCGADIEYAGVEGFPPLKIRGRRLHGGTVDIDSTVSSQYISALMMVAPTFTSPLTLNLEGEPASMPYIKMTLGMMTNRGIEAEMYNDVVQIAPGEYREPETDDIERDWSAAQYWYSVAALSAGWVTLQHMALPSLQGDSKIAAIAERLGVLTNEEDGNIELSASPEVYSRLDIDLAETPDLVQSLVVTCCMIGVPFHFTGVKSLRIKETDRIEALRAEVMKVGCILEIPNDNEIKWDGRRRPLVEMPVFDTYGDHRMAMSLAPVAVFINGIVIRDAEVVNKSYPGFWEDIQKAGFAIIPVDDENKSDKNETDENKADE